MSRTFTVGQPVKYRCEFPHKRLYGIVRELKTQPWAANEKPVEGVVVEWHDNWPDYDGSEYFTTFVPLFNQRLCSATRRDWVFGRLAAEAQNAKP